MKILQVLEDWTPSTPTLLSLSRGAGVYMGGVGGGGLVLMHLWKI